MLEVKELSVSYGQHRALENAGLKVGRGEIVVILGANGAGKSTLLKAVSGICEGRVTGTVSMQGSDILGIAPHRIVEEGIALVPEGRGVFGDLSVAENLKLGAHASRAREDEAGNLQRVLQLFPKLHERRNQIVRTMSGGEQQMVAIGRAMMSSPALLTLDEPSLGLSPLLSKELFQALKLVRDTGIGILLVEQNAKQSLAIADRGYLIENGHIIHEGRAEDLRNDPAVQAAYLGGGKAAATGPWPGGRAAMAAASTPAPTSAPAAAYVAPRPTGASPADIAAAALAALPSAPMRGEVAAPHPASASLGHPLPASGASGNGDAAADPFSPLAGRRSRQGDEGQSDAMYQGQATVRPSLAAPTPAAMRSAADALLGGLSLNDIVAEASRSSRAQHERLPRAPQAGSRSSAEIPRAPSPSLSLGSSQDRLKSVLQEIEDAAARAQTLRHDGNRN
ncbi:ABC transporter ATP-binding protein [Rhizobium sp. FY34]|uniref:ATP-binding cassette domain-containing protein n=1 Tax=Rhizobium sp. FY34 TaxID=2562309 RepID=UPI0010C0833E